MQKADFLVPEGAEGLLWAPGASAFGMGGDRLAQHASETRTPEGCSAHRISLPYTRSLFFAPSVPLKMRRVPQEGVFAHRTHIPYHRRPLSCTECHKHNAVASCGADYRVINTLITAMPSLRTSAPWKPPGTRNNRFAGKPLQLFQKLRELSRSFFIFVPNKYRNTQCKLFTTNTTNSWNLPR